MKALILGHGKHGKDTVAALLRDMYGLSFASSSEAAMMAAVWPTMRLRATYAAPIECFADRHNHREEWRRLIAEYNTPDKARLCREILATSDIYVGMRHLAEYEVCRPLFDLVIWVHRPGHPVDPSMDIPYDDHAMHLVVNAGNHELLRHQLHKIMRYYL